MGKINPLLVIMSPRDIPWVKEKMDKIDYVDKVWFKYTPTDETLKRISKYFREHTEYTHLIIHADDGAPEYDAVAMLVADAEKYDFAVITGCCCMNKLYDDMFLNLTFDPVMKSYDDELRRENYHLLPYEFRELNGIIKVWFEGNALAMIRRDIFEKIGLRTWTGRFGADISFSFECAQNGVEQYVDLRAYMDHYKYPQDIPPYNIKIKNIESKIIIEPARKKVIPKAEPAKIITEIPESYQKLYDFYYGKAIKLNVCIVSEFEPNNYFQWYEAIKTFITRPKRYGNSYVICDEINHIINLSNVIMSKNIMEIYGENSVYWNPLRTADLVFVYCARQNESKDWEWYMLPIWAKRYMKDNAKMIAQFDDEFMWLWHKNHIFWKDGLDISLSPKKFFENGVLDVADLYLTVLSKVPWAKYTTKPIVYMPLPQLTRYNVDRLLPKYKPNDVKYVAILRHSVNSADIGHTIENVIKPLNLPVMLFCSNVIDKTEEKRLIASLPPHSQVYSRKVPHEYMRLLKNAFVAIDDNEGYLGWSRFALECAISTIPCIGSTDAINHINSELYTKHKDYNKQITLIRNMLSDENNYRYLRYAGFYRVKYSFSIANMVTKLLKIIVIDLEYPVEYLTIEETLNAAFIAFAKTLRERRIPPKPKEGVTTFDKNFKKIIGEKEWMEIYGRFESIINDTELRTNLLKKATR